MSDQPERDVYRRSLLERLLGDKPSGVIIRLVLMSLVVGFLMSVFGVNARDIFEGTLDLFRDVLRNGFGVFGDVGTYIVTGAALVLPIWLILRLTKGR